MYGTAPVNLVANFYAWTLKFLAVLSCLLENMLISVVMIVPIGETFYLSGTPLIGLGSVII